MKKCFKCNIEKPIDFFYKHKAMKDGRLNKCIECTKLDVKKRSIQLMKNPIELEKERTRGREKYHRLNYKDKIKPTYQQKKTCIDNYKLKYPEKYKCKIASQRLKKELKENHLHHWSYNKKHYKDVIELSVKDHNTVHRFLIYNQKTFMYCDVNKNLLDTKEKHLKYIEYILK